MNTKKNYFLQITTLVIISFCTIGCSNKFWDPSQIGRFRPVPVEHVILESLGVAEEDSPVYEGAEEPKPKDILAVEQDYRFNSGDIVRISIYELLEENLQFINDFVISETGKVSIPEVGVVQAGGLTEKQLEEEIRQILSPNILKDPAVTVILQQSQKRAYSIYGQGLLGSPGRYGIPRYNFRLAEAVAIAGGVSEFNVSYIYITRELSAAEIAAKTKELRENGITKKADTSATSQIEFKTAEPTNASPRRKKADENDLLELIAPSDGLDGMVIASADMTTEQELEALIMPEAANILDSTVENDAAKATSVQSDTKIEWVFKDGKWVPVEVVADTPKERPQLSRAQREEFQVLEERVPESIEDQMETFAQQTRVLKVPYDKLVGGDPKYNIVIKEGDTISVPVDVIGECVIMGNVNAQGYIPLTGRPMTLMQAIAAAGGLGPLAAPENVEVRRRIGKKREEIVQVNLAKIAEGLQPDFFIKKDDTINVGTDATSTWKAILRNSFRATYGFGFVYDRNYADRDLGTSRPFSFF